MLEVVVCCCDDGVIDDAEGVGDPDVLIDIFRLFEVDGWDDRVLVERGFFKLISSPSTKNELGERERVCVCVFENAKEKVATIRTIKQSIKSIQKEQNK